MYLVDLCVSSLEMNKIYLLGLYWIWRRKKLDKKNNSIKRNRSIWVRRLFKQELRKHFGAGNNLMKEMRLNEKNKHNNFFRMGPEAFDHLLSIVGSHIQKVDVRREPINPTLRLAITLRYLATGDSMTSLSYLFRVGLSTVSNIISETTKIIWEQLQPIVLTPPSERDWLNIAAGFNTTWHFPNCIGAIDGKHITIQAPPNAGSEFFNYKGTHSIVLMAVVDDKYRFTLVDIGAQGRQSDGGIFKNCQIGKKLLDKKLNIPNSATISSDRSPLPFVIVGDEAFPLLENLLRPYPRKGCLDVEKNIFNYRLSRARRVSENAFGILVARWRIFSRSIIAKLENIENIVKASICLHNFVMMMHYNPSYCSPDLIDREIQEGRVIYGTWRQEIFQLESLGRMGTNMHCNNAKIIRDTFKDYFNEEGAVPWQWDHC